MEFEFLIPIRPVSHQTRNRANLQRWKSYVRDLAIGVWTGPIWCEPGLELRLIYLANEDPVDVDNIIKPIQDALIGVIYLEDGLVTDVESHRRPIKGTFDITHCSKLLTEALLSNDECVYVSVVRSKALEDYL